MCKIENKLGNRHELFFHFLHRKRVIHKKNVKKGVHGHEPNGRMIQPTQLIIISIEAQFCALQNFRVFFLFNFIPQVINFYSEK